MNIAVASGKGGTGKTTVAANLAVFLSRSGENVVYADCDVEEPNGHIFLKPRIDDKRTALLSYPVVDAERCIACGKCQAICEFNAIILIGESPMVFPDLCHACGGCIHVCPVNALSEEQRGIGAVETGAKDALSFVQGRLDIGQVLSPPLIREVKLSIPDADYTIIDCPPGTSCPVITALRDADFVLLVTEPTPFGLHDLKLAVEAVQSIGIPHGVFINRFDLGDAETVSFCRTKGVPVIGKIPDDTRIARTYSEGSLVIDALPEYDGVFSSLFDGIKERVGGEVAKKAVSGTRRQESNQSETA
ncbi:MAG: ATP-binding protein, partial [Candidatus Latescibacteria bacterium]|nr:ATP-binding protein [Candidatus Latescibacterota bacterium]